MNENKVSAFENQIKKFFILGKNDLIWYFSNITGDSFQEINNGYDLFHFLIKQSYN